MKMDLIEDLDNVVSKLETILCRPEQTFITKYMKSDYLYFLVGGRVEVIVHKNKKESTRLLFRQK